MDNPCIHRFYMVQYCFGDRHAAGVEALVDSWWLCCGLQVYFSVGSVDDLGLDLQR